MRFFIKRNIIILTLIVILPLKTFSASFNNNDGSAFITKAEFDSLKNNFQSQIDKYNQSIDNKIDTAIASYLTGVKIASDVQGANYIKNINSVNPVRFYSNSTNTINTSTIDKLYFRYLWRYFGTYYSTNTLWGDNVYKKQHWVEGSFLYDMFSGGHDRSFVMNSTGEETNYFYQISKKKFNGTDGYVSLDDDCTKSVSGSVGAYYFGVYSKTSTTNSGSWITIPTTFTFNHKDLAFDYKQNTIQPKEYEVDLKFDKKSLPGAEWNIWKKTNNPKDCIIFNNFTNTTYDLDKDLLCFTYDNFINFTDYQTLTSSYRCSGDFWFSFLGIKYVRTYTWRNWDYCYNDGITGSGDYKFGTLKYYRPLFETFKSGKVVLDTASSQIDKAVYPYSGVPFTTMVSGSINMNADLSVKLYDSSDVQKTGKPYYVLLSTVPFGNVNTSDLISAGETDKLKIFNNTTGTVAQTITLDQSFLSNVTDGSVFYIRVMPTDNTLYATVDCNSIVFRLEN